MNIFKKWIKLNMEECNYDMEENNNNRHFTDADGKSDG